MLAKYKKIAATASGDTGVIPAKAGKQFLILHYIVVCKTAVDVKFVSGSTDLTGTMGFGANGGANAGQAQMDTYGLFTTLAANEALKINLSGNATVGGHITYLEFDSE